MRGGQDAGAGPARRVSGFPNVLLTEHSSPLVLCWGLCNCGWLGLVGGLASPAEFPQPDCQLGYISSGACPAPDALPSSIVAHPAGSPRPANWISVHSFSILTIYLPSAIACDCLQDPRGRLRGPLAVAHCMLSSEHDCLPSPTARRTTVGSPRRAMPTTTTSWTPTACASRVSIWLRVNRNACNAGWLITSWTRTACASRVRSVAETAATCLSQHSLLPSPPVLHRIWQCRACSERMCPLW